MNNSKIGRPYINEVTYSGLSIGARLKLKSKRKKHKIYKITQFSFKTTKLILNKNKI